MRSKKGSETDRCFIGKVAYPTDAKLMKFARTFFKDGLSAHAVARSLLVKRNAFAHEDEVRLIYFEGDRILHENGVYKYPLEPHAVFDQVMIDPRLSYKQYVSFKDEIFEKTGFDEARIKRSLLYKPPEGFIIEIP